MVGFVGSSMRARLIRRATTHRWEGGAGKGSEVPPVRFLSRVLKIHKTNLPACAGRKDCVRASHTSAGAATYKLFMAVHAGAVVASLPADIFYNACASMRLRDAKGTDIEEGERRSLEY